MGLFDFFKKKRDNTSVSIQGTEAITQNWKYDRTPELSDIACFVVEKQECNTAAIQRFFKIGFNAAAVFINQLQQAGIVDNEREVLLTNKDEVKDVLDKQNCSTQNTQCVSSGFVDSDNYLPDNLMSIKELADYDCYVGNVVK